MRYIAVLKQEGGCDYTIACGTKVILLDATSMEDAMEKLYLEVEENYQCDSKLSDALIYEVNNTHIVNMDSWYKSYKTHDKKEQAEREQYERLKLKFG